MSAGFPEMRHPLPNFRRWMEERGHTQMGDSFEAFADLARRTQEQNVVPGLSQAESAMLRMWQGVSMAVVELCNMEEAHGTPRHVIVSVMARALACAAFYSTVSTIRDDAPMRSIAKILTEEFRVAAKICADEYQEKLTAGFDASSP